MKLVLKVLIALFAVGCLSQTMLAQDPVKIAPHNYRVQLENDEVRVLNIWLNPGDIVPLHSHPESVIYALSGGTGKFTDEHGKSTIVTMKAGQCTWRNHEKHTVQNVGKHPMHVLQVELKGLHLF